MSMSEERWDAIVVGAGQGGLTAAAYLAVAGGLKVLVLEANAIAGGSAQVFRRRGRYEFDVGTHYLPEGGPGGVLHAAYRGLGLGERIAFAPLDPDCFDRVVLPDLDVSVPADPAGYRERMAAALPGEADAVRAYADLTHELYQRVRAEVIRPYGTAPEPGDRPLGGWSTATLDKLMRHCGLSARARTALAAQSLNYGLAPKQVSALGHAAMLGDYLAGAWYPEGGGQQLSASLIEALAGYGGQLRTRSRVERILVRGGRTAGVRLTDGTELHAPIVVSNADYRRTVLELVGAEHLPAAATARAERAVMALPLVSLYLAVDARVVRPPAHNIWWYETEDIDGLYQRLADGEFDQPEVAFLSSGSAKNPAHHAADHHTIEVITVAPPGWEHWTVDPADATPAAAEAYAYRRDEVYQRQKQRLEQQLLDLAERILGTPLRGHLLHCELATPLSQIRFTGATGGTPYGLATTPRQYGALRPDHATALPGLFLTGSSSRNGCGISAVTVGGVRAAELVLEQSLLSEVLAGKVYGSAAALPERGPGWDPLLASRGTRADRHPGRRERS
ncbi:phytoene dehydrogenase [Catellatospora sp. TT07R-123]|uniref:phytoene desaturase family protein n=1 Tax=Catellatospora sp. TT07R-123 TaxID=2733863 RepID=UPI001B089B02|nr:NAD(P)/FAD-dependent oxidoreductase [Catellatospora sp. TT07R-123]GHJ48863.1 phytoene dehydrogenase [Catellatospora sp. TT07R-123]